MQPQRSEFGHNDACHANFKWRYDFIASDIITSLKLYHGATPLSVTTLVIMTLSSESIYIKGPGPMV
jgi:hypothetical protein